MAKFLSPDSRSDWKLGCAEKHLTLVMKLQTNQHDVSVWLYSRGVTEAHILVSSQFVHEVHDLQTTAQFRGINLLTNRMSEV